MQTEIEKYDQINQFLKGQLTDNELDAFEISLKNDPDLASEVAMHQLVNEAIVDHYLIDVKANTQKVLAQKAFQSNIRNWGFGLGATLLVGTIYMLCVSENSKSTIKINEILLINKIKTEPNDTQLNLTTFKIAKPSKRNSKFVEEPTKPNFTNEVQATDIKPISENNRLEEKKHVESVKKEDVIENIEEQITQNVPIQNPVEEKKQESHAPKDIQLILNLSRNEPVLLPIESDFNGEFSVFGSDGNVAFQNTIRNGFPNTWDGLGISGQVATGQYGFVLKSENGQVINAGFITVVR